MSGQEKEDSFPYQSPETLDQPVNEQGIPIKDLDLLHFHPFAERGRVSDEPIDPQNGAFQEITQAIQEKGGQIPYSEFMRISLFGKDGYYSKGKAQIGSDAEQVHFSTSPEISAAFGATIGNQMARVWETMGKPPTFRIVELGGGTGALAQSLLESLQEKNPDFYQALSYTILEYGDLIASQRAKINSSRLPDSEKSKVTWAQGSATDLPFEGIEGAIISNEVPDAFPIERVVKIDGQIKQKYVTVDERGRFFEVLGEPSQEVLDYITTYNINLAEKTEEPINLNAVKFQRSVDRALKRGVVLTIDYGRNSEVGAVGSDDYHSLRFKGRPFDKQTQETISLDSKDQVDDLFPYKYPGQIDITARVNFKVLSEIARNDNLSVAFSGTQEQFLTRAGIYDEVRRMESAEDRSNVEKLLLTIDGNYGSYYAQLLSKGLELTLPSTKSFGPTPFEHSESVFEEVTKELGFVENERLRMFRVILTNLLRRNDEPTIPEEDLKESDFPPEVIELARRYEETAEALYDKIPATSDRADVKFHIGLDLALSRIFYEGGWKNTSRRRTTTASQYADEMGVQFPGLFERVVEATKQPDHKN